MDRLTGGTFSAETAHGTVLAADLDSRQLINLHPGSISARTPLVFVYLPEASADLAFLLFDNPRRMAIAPRARQPGGPVITLRCERLREPGNYAFYHPHFRYALVALPGEPPGSPGPIDFHDKPVPIRPWEIFKLERTEANTSASVRHNLGLVQRALQTPAVPVLELLRDATPADRPVLADILSGTVSPTQAELLASELLAHPSRMAEFVKVLPDDPWAGEGLPRLAAFVQRRAWLSSEAAKQQASLSWLGGSTQVTAAPPVSTGLWSRLFRRPLPQIGRPPEPPVHPGQSVSVKVDRSLDQLARHGLSGEFASLPHQILAAARRAVPPARELCILATARNEGPYLIDWIAYHRSVGVEHLFIYTNNNSDGSDALLEALAKAGVITLYHNDTSPGVSPQYKAYGHALSIVPELLDYRWCAIIDLDEWIGFDTSLFTSLRDYLAWQELRPVDAIALNWSVVTSSRTLRWVDKPMPQRFRQRFPESHLPLKTILRPRGFHQSNPHNPLTDSGHSVNHRDAAGNLQPFAIPQRVPPPDAPAWISHYFFRSFEEFVWKFARGRGDQPLQSSLPPIAVPDNFMQAFVQHFDEPRAAADDRMLLCADHMDGELRRLRQLPGVATAYAGVVQHYQERSAQLSAQLRAQPPTSPTEQAFFDLYLAPAV